MVVAVRDHGKNLFQLVDAVRGHNGGIFIEKIRKPAEQAGEEAKKRNMLDLFGIFCQSIRNCKDEQKGKGTVNKEKEPCAADCQDYQPEKLVVESVR